MTSMAKNVSRQSIKQVGTPPVVASERAVGMLDYDTANRAEHSQNVQQSADMHSQRSRDRSEHYHARVIGQKTPAPATQMQSPRPGLTAQQGLGG